MTVPILAAHRDWYCPNCGQTARTAKVNETPGHVCPKLRFLSVPFLPAGTPGIHVLHEREDYVGRENVQLDPELGRPVMNIVTTRDHGQDCQVYAPTASAQVGDM